MKLGNILKILGTAVGAVLKRKKTKSSNFDSIPSYNVMYPLKGYYVTSPMGKWGKWWNWYWDKKDTMWKRGQIDGKGQHKGYDFAVPENVPVYAAIPGVVEYVGWEDPKDPNKGFGIYLRQRTKDNHKIYYAHLKTYFVKKGESLRTGQKIGLTGNTGRSSGPHLHFEVRKNLQPQPVFFQLI